MITLSSTPQNNSLNALHADAGQFDLFRVLDLPVDRPAATPPTLVPPMPAIASGPTFETIMERYFSEVIEVKRAKKGQDWVRSLLRSCIYPVLGDRPFFEIKRSEILALTKAIGTTRPKRYLDRVDGREGRSNSVHFYLRKFWAWASTPLEEGGANLLEISPMAGLKQPYRDKERTRVLDDDEIRYFWIACGELGYPFGTIARLLLLTGQRRSEIANAYQWQISRGDRMLSVPVNKSRRPHLVPLSTFALELLDAVPQGDPRRLVFPDRRDMTIRSTYFSTATRRIHKRMVKLMREDFVRAGRDPADVYIAPWVFHDLRRTASTLMCQLGHHVEVVDKILNHGHAGGGIGRTVNTTTRIYCRHELLDERRAALQDLAKFIRKLVSGDPADAEKR